MMLDQVVRVRRSDGTEITAGQEIIDRVQLGMSLAAAADSAGVSRMTLYNWRTDGAKYRALQAQGRLPKPTRTQSLLIEFVDNLSRAEAEAEVQRLGIVARAGAGGQVITKTTTRKDETGQVVETITVTETLKPDWRAARWWLAVRRGYVERHDLAIIPGGELVPQDDAARGIAESLREYLAGYDDAQAALPAAKE